MERIAFIVDALNSPPFCKGYGTLTELDSKSAYELLDLTAEIIVSIDPDQEFIYKEPTEAKVQSILQFLKIMKFNMIPDEQMDDFSASLMNGHMDAFHIVMYWMLQKHEHLVKRAYLAKYLMPMDVPAEFMGEDLIIELVNRLKSLQGEFKEVHKTVDQLRATTGTRPAELKAEIAQLEQERLQLQNKITKMKKDSMQHGDDNYFNEMLKATSELRKEQEEEIRLHERVREYRKNLSDVENKLVESTKKLSEMRQSGIGNQTAEQLLAKLQKDVKEIQDRHDNMESALADREQHLNKLQGWDKSDRITTEDDVRLKRDQLQEVQEQVSIMTEKLDHALERNQKLIVFRQASSMALKRLREKEEEIEKLNEDKRRAMKAIEEKEADLRSKGLMGSSQVGKMDLKKYGAVVKDKIEKYKRMRDELSAVRSELVVLQRTEAILKSRHKNLDHFLSELEKQRGVEGYRDTQKQLIEMSEKASEIDAMKGATLEQISTMVEQINREFKQKQQSLQPMMNELKQTRQRYLELEQVYLERKSGYDKVAVGLEMEKQSLESQCDALQDEALREESRFHYLTNLIAIAKIKLNKAEQEKKWQSGESKMVRDFATLKDLYNSKLGQQEQLIKQLRKKQKELKENSAGMTNQKSNFLSLQALLAAKVKDYESIFSGEVKAKRADNRGNGGYGNNYGAANVLTIDDDDDYAYGK